MNFPGSPYLVLERLLEEYHSGKRSIENVEEALDVFDMFLEQWNEGFEAMPLDPEIFPEGEANLEGSLHCLDLFSEAAGLIRAYFDEGNEELMDQGLELARQGHEQMEKLYLALSQKVDEVANEVG